MAQWIAFSVSTRMVAGSSPVMDAHNIPCSLTVRMVPFQGIGPGSIPGKGIKLLSYLSYGLIV